jgi:iron complex outermembrane receptor protein
VAFGQNAASTPQSGATEPQLEEITVTARHRKESLQAVPVAVSVVSGEQALRANLNDIQDISAEIPTVNFRTSSSNKDRTLFIRGIGTISTSPGVEPSVATVVDGVVLARSGQTTLDILDLDHIEVLRGPQGTLFGKNASAGVINIVTLDPTADYHAYGDAAYFSGGDEYRLKGGASGGLIPDKLTGMFSALIGNYDGNVTNLYNHETVNGYSHYGFRSKLVATPADALKVTLAFDYMRSEDTIPNGVFTASTQTAYPTGVVTQNPALASLLSGSAIIASPDNRQISNDLVSGTTDDNGGFAATVDYTLGDHSLTSITAYRKWRNDQVQDYDQLSQLTLKSPKLADHGTLTFDQFSEEARIASPKGGLIDYVGGFYFMHAVDAEVYRRSLQQLTAAGVVSNAGVSTYGTTGDNYAVFGEADLNLTDSFRLIAGLRLVRDDLDYGFNRVSTSAVALTGIRPAFASAGSTESDDYSGRTGLQYDLLQDVTAYFTYSRGYKGPAFNVFFNMQPTDTLALKPETSNAYEIGLKSRFWDDRVQANVAAFMTDFDNYQANFSDVANGALVTRLINAGQVSTQGVEADLTARATQYLTLTTDAAFTHARVDKFNCPANAAASCNINGQPLPFAPDWKLSVRADYLAPLSDVYDLTFDTSYDWQSKTQYQLSETPDTIQGAYGVWDGGVTLANRDQNWRITVLVKNILDTHYASYIAHGNLGGVVRWVPRDNDRYAGIELHKDF